VTVSDYIIDVLLIGVVFRQMRPRELDARSALLPLVLAAVAAAEYLHPYRAAGNDVRLTVLLAASGAVLGALSGTLTEVSRGEDGTVVARAGAVAAGAWVLGMGFRFAFAVYSTHSGREAVTRFSGRHGITSAQAWTTALVLMAIAEVLARVAVLQARRTRLVHAAA
jgi:hypothetical protein